MCSYNRINGVYASENRMLLTRILREQWGFDLSLIHISGTTETRLTAGATKALQRCLTPVSYTHLDVYKRQLVDNKPAFPIVNILQGEGAIGPYSFGYLGTEPLFLTKLGVCLLYTSRCV